MCHMAPEVSDFIPSPFDNTDKHIEVSEGYHVMEKQKGHVQIKIGNKKGETFIATLHKVLLAPDLCDRLFSIITLINSIHTCLFQEGFCMFYFGAKDKNAVTLPHIAQTKYAFWG